MLEVSSQLLGRYIKEHKADGDDQALRGNGKAQVKQLEMEKLILKEATVLQIHLI